MSMQKHSRHNIRVVYFGTEILISWYIEIIKMFYILSRYTVSCVRTGDHLIVNKQLELRVSTQSMYSIIYVDDPDDIKRRLPNLMYICMMCRSSSGSGKMRLWHVDDYCRNTQYRLSEFDGKYDFFLRQHQQISLFIRFFRNYILVGNLPSNLEELRDLDFYCPQEYNNDMCTSLIMRTVYGRLSNLVISNEIKILNVENTADLKSQVSHMIKTSRSSTKTLPMKSNKGLDSKTSSQTSKKSANKNSR